MLVFDLMFSIRLELFVFIAVCIVDSQCVFVFVLTFSGAADVVLVVEKHPILFAYFSI